MLKGRAAQDDGRTVDRFPSRRGDVRFGSLVTRSSVP